VQAVNEAVPVYHHACSISASHPHYLVYQYNIMTLESSHSDFNSIQLNSIQYNTSTSRRQCLLPTY
jgi:hypothetical protein